MKKIILYALLITLTCYEASAQFTPIFHFDSTHGATGNTLVTDGVSLYGVTGNGGAYNEGILYKINPDGTGFVKLHDFNADATPSSLVFDGTFFYGVADFGGANDYGSVIKIKPDGTGFFKLHQFTGIANGYWPVGSLVAVDSFLYGMTSAGGANDNGVIYKIKPDGTGFAMVFDFTTNATSASGSLIYDGTFLYGMTGYGGGGGGGHVFKIKPDGTGFVNLHVFSGTDGGNPRGSLISDGTFLYGMAAGGGFLNAQPVIFKVKPDGTGFAVMHDLGAPYEHYPYGDLLLDNGFLYGMTSTSGSDSLGILFKINTDGTGFTKLRDFSKATGGAAYGSLISDGTFLYGTLSYEGANDMGVIFKYQDSTITGIGNHAAATDLLVYPNPSSGTFTIERKGQAPMEEVDIYTVMGERIYQTTIRGQSSHISLNIPDGIYFIHITSAQGIVSRKIVVRH